MRLYMNKTQKYYLTLWTHTHKGQNLINVIYGFVLLKTMTGMHSVIPGTAPSLTVGGDHMFE